MIPMLKAFRFGIAVLFLAIAAPAWAQQSPDVQLVQVADEMYNFGDIKDALEVYVQATELNPENVRAHFMAGKCYLTTIEKSKALYFLHKAYDLDRHVDPSILFLIGYAHHLNYEFDQAITFYEQYKDKVFNDQESFNRDDKARKEEVLRIDHKIQECKNAEMYMGNPVDIEMYNLGKSINSVYKDYGPVISEDQKTIYFTSRRKGSTGGNKDNDNEYFEDIYVSKLSDTSWSEPLNLGFPINSDIHESVIALSRDGKELFLYVDKDNNPGDIFSSKLDNKGNWMTPKSIGTSINTPFIENSITLSKDGTTMYFASNREGGIGGFDIYIAKKNAKGEWGNPENLGGTINTEYDEEGPFLDVDGKTLYFSSKGHEGMGGYDLYRSKYDSIRNTWGPAENLGFPINSTDDDIYFVLASDGIWGYFSSAKSDGIGDADLYKIRMPENFFRKPFEVKKDPQPKDSAAVALKATDVFNSKLNIMVIDKVTKKPINASIELVDFNTDLDLANGTASNGAYSWENTTKKSTVVLISVNANGYVFRDVKVTVPGPSNTVKTMSQVIEMEKPSVGQKLILRNIYFDFDKATLHHESITELKNILAFMNNNAHIKVEISGHTDSKGNDDYNLNLSQRRAETVVNWLIENGIAKDRMIAKGYGEKMPLASNDDEEEGRELNRRIELKILSND
jgi:outer membrane protein OmpA-like peptidoglycan-associated protein